MTPFLKAVAQAYISQTEVPLSECCFVFPNRRSGIFFRKFISESLGNKSVLLPHITAITDLIVDMSGDIEPNRIEMLFLLYRSYQSIAKRKGMYVAPFSRFIFWGDMILNDFNDIDKSLADAGQIFSNLKNFNEIRSTFLSDDQLHAIEDFFGISMSKDYTDEYGNPVERFWLHIGEDDSKGKFLKLWNVLYPLYEEFNKRLVAEHKNYQGAMYRKIARQIDDTDADRIDWKRYIFVGFNHLTESERHIFRSLQKKGVADFYWDCNSPILNSESNLGTYFIRKNRERFPSRYPDFEDKNENIPEVTLVSIPSNSGMAKAAAGILQEFPDDQLIPNRDNAMNTAVILPDETLFLPMYSAIPDSFKEVNITLGTPMKMFPITSLLTTILSLHRRTWNKDGAWHFFHEDVKNLLSNPYIYAFAPVQTSDFLEALAKSKRKMVPLDDLKTIHPKLSPVFTKIAAGTTANEAFEYVERMIDIIKILIANQRAIIEKKHASLNYSSSLSDDQNKTDAKTEENRVRSLDEGLLGRLYQLIAQLQNIIYSYRDIDLQGDTYLMLIQRLINSSTVALEGEPLCGLQVMGVLETRNLDFDNLIILSANEKVYPRRMFTKSMIPQNLRVGYNLPTNEHEESVSTYYFYRMLSRAKRVFLLYDTRNHIRSGGEESRYIYQMRYLYNKMIKLHARSYSMKIYTPDIPTIEIPKTPRIMQLLDRYRYNGDNESFKKYFSASALKKYLLCPLQFYLMYVEELRPPENKDDNFIDSATFGTILHDTMKELYYGSDPKGYFELNKVLDKNDIEKLADGVSLDMILSKLINYHHYNIRDWNEAAAKAPTGESLIIIAIMKKFIEQIIRYDAARAPITFISAEAVEKKFWELAPGIGINFQQFIDRLDRLPDGTTRVIDYKTGSDSLKTKSIEEMFTASEKLHSVQGIFQLMIYCNFHNYYNDTPGLSLQPVIYKTKDFFGKQKANSKEFMLKIDKQPITSHLDFREEFMARFTDMIREIFNPEIAFRQCSDNGTCQYCGFADFCRRK